MMKRKVTTSIFAVIVGGLMTTTSSVFGQGFKPVPGNVTFTLFYGNDVQGKSQFNNNKPIGFNTVIDETPKFRTQGTLGLRMNWHTNKGSSMGFDLNVRNFNVDYSREIFSGMNVVDIKSMHANTYRLSAVFNYNHYLTKEDKRFQSYLISAMGFYFDDMKVYEESNLLEHRKMFEDISEPQLTGRFGVGFDFYVHRNLALNSEIAIGQTIFTFGITYKM